MSLFVGRFTNLNFTKNKSYNDNCSKSEGNLSNTINNKEFKTKEKSRTNFDFISNKSFINKNDDRMKDKISNKELKTKKCYS